MLKIFLKGKKVGVFFVIIIRNRNLVVAELQFELRFSRAFVLEPTTYLIYPLKWPKIP